MTARKLTQRDMYIITKSLAYAIVTIEGLPSEKRSLSDLADMTELLTSLTPTPNA